MLVLVITVAMVIRAINGQSILIGGRDASVDQHPYQVSFQLPSGLHFCSGFLVSSLTVVTAAHCLLGLDRYKIRTYTVRAGSSFFNKGGQLVHVDRAIVHPGFNALTNDNDIALLKLSSAITDKNARNAILPVDSSLNTYLNVTGWGTGKEGDDIPGQLQIMQLKIIDTDTCEKIYRTKKITASQFCVTSPDKSTCSADCSAPAVIGNTVYGIFSRGINCADSAYPSIYTRISFFREWILQNSSIKRRVIRRKKIIPRPKTTPKPRIIRMKKILRIPKIRRRIKSLKH